MKRTIAISNAGKNICFVRQLAREYRCTVYDVNNSANATLDPDRQSVTLSCAAGLAECGHLWSAYGALHDLLAKSSGDTKPAAVAEIDALRPCP